MLRSYFYHARPYDGIVKNPINGSTTNYSDTPVFREQNSLLDSIELMPSFALRLGELSQNSWRLGNRALRQLARQPRVIEADDLVPDISQKGVDLRIGLDIARLALRETVDLIVVVSGDSDLIPAFKFARREGLQVLLVPFDHGVKRELKAHADRVIDLQL